MQNVFKFRLRRLPSTHRLRDRVVIVKISELLTNALCQTLQALGKPQKLLDVLFFLYNSLNDSLNLRNRKIYCITEDDQIFVSSPQTFDPFMVDICLAVNHGASLVMTSHNLRCDARKLLDILFPYRKESNVSVMQITPSLFMRWSSNDIEHRVFSQTSRLRILSFGGEAFPQTSTLRKWKHWKNAPSIQIFNLYGLTEISCWAAIYEITKDDILCTRKVPIGYPMDPYTKFQVNADGELLLRSTVRKCFGSELTDEQVYDDDFEFVLHTGDLVNVENGSYYFQSRQNSVIKIYGKKFNMAAIELQTKEINHVEDAVCVHNEEQNLIMLFVKVDGNFNNVKREILEAIQSVGVRVKIVCVTKFPITKHGKICKSELLNTANDEQSMEQPIELILQQLINDTLGTTIHFSNAVESSDFRKRSKEEIHSSFIHLGGNSLKAIQIVDEFERKITHSISYLLPMLLHERFSVHDVLCRLANEKTIIKISTAVIEPEIKEITPCWKIDMGKCIDATPTVCLLKDNEAIVSVGSHSRLLYNISIKSGEFISKLELPDRIESQVTQKGSFGFFGCYDGYMYCFAIRNGSLKWKFSTGAMIKCRALLINRLLLFGNYSETNNFWCLDADTGNLMWSQKIGSKSIYANPIESENGNVVVCSLDGTVALLNSVSAKVFWYFQSEAPVFSTPTVFRNRSKQLRIVVLAVNGAMYGLNSDGEPLWNTRIEGNIFSSPQNFICSMDQNCTNVVFGSQNGNLYCYRIDADNHCTELWKFTTSASIRSNPIFMTKEHELYIGIFSSDGIVTIVNSKDGTLISQRKINGEIFSSPVIHDGNLFVGCRNNFLYSIDLKDLI